MTVHKLTRSGNAPLLIDGDEIARADGATFRGKVRNRWHQIVLWRTANGYAAAVAYHTSWEGEAEWHAAAEVRTLAQLVEWLNNCQRQPAKIGYPVGQQFESRQRALEAELDAQYASLVSEVLNADGLDWTSDHGPSDREVSMAVWAIDEAIQGDDPSDLDKAIQVLQTATVAQIKAGIADVSEDYEEVPTP